MYMKSNIGLIISIYGIHEHYIFIYENPRFFHIDGHHGRRWLILDQHISEVVVYSPFFFKLLIIKVDGG